MRCGDATAIETHLDHPGDITWFKGHGPLTVVGPCPHDCRHYLQANIAWGPDYEHYTLNRCDVPDGCNRRCRGWSAEFPHNDPRRDYSHGWMQVTE